VKLYISTWPPLHPKGGLFFHFCHIISDIKSNSQGNQSPQLYKKKPKKLSQKDKIESIPHLCLTSTRILLNNMGPEHKRKCQ